MEYIGKKTHEYNRDQYFQIDNWNNQEQFDKEKNKSRTKSKSNFIEIRTNFLKWSEE